jgi:hypothetical protein
MDDLPIAAAPPPILGGPVAPWIEGVLAVEHAGHGGLTGMGVLVEPDKALTTADMDPTGLLFRPVEGAGEGEAGLGPGVAGHRVAHDPETRLALSKLEQPLGAPARLAAADPPVGTRARKLSRFSPVRTGRIVATGVFTQIVGSGGGVETLAGLLALEIPAAPGDAGSPLVDEHDAVVGVLVAGAEDQTRAAPVSAIRELLSRSA